MARADANGSFAGYLGCLYASESSRTYDHPISRKMSLTSVSNNHTITSLAAYVGSESDT
jgi:hypothetical protein